jgi:hypothetical protein
MRKNQSPNRGIMRDWIFRLPKECNQGARVRSALIPVNSTCIFGVALQISLQLTLTIGGEE